MPATTSDIQSWLLTYGADAQVIVFFSVLLTFIVIERVLPYRVHLTSQVRRWATNAGLTLTAILVLPLMPMSMITAGYWAEQNNFGLMNQFEWPIFIAVLATLLLRGFVSFFTHWLNHALPWLWRLHRVHHLDTELDVSSTVRFHPLEMPVSALIGIPLIAVFGLSPWMLLFYELLDVSIVIFSHSNLSIPKSINRWLSYIIVTPDLHRIHHSSFQPETDSNYSAVFPIWDVLFGTFRQDCRDPQNEMELGLVEVRDERAQDFLWLIASPFRTLQKPQEHYAHEDRSEEAQRQGT
jgi:sterol desaturase/sphingolipid hydroxylase (fatty acid hydroxylase superfamily)